ncbi:unnamed protein product, partial [Scytosiphon promiscuus]
MTHISHTSGRKRPSYDTDGINKPKYCKQHADTSMVDVISGRCSDSFCIRRASCNVKSGKAATHCKRQADNIMVNI